MQPWWAVGAAGLYGARGVRDVALSCRGAKSKKVTLGRFERVEGHLSLQDIGSCAG